MVPIPVTTFRRSIEVMGQADSKILKLVVVEDPVTKTHTVLFDTGNPNEVQR